MGSPLFLPFSVHDCMAELHIIRKYRFSSLPPCITKSDIPQKKCLNGKYEGYAFSMGKSLFKSYLSLGFIRHTANIYIFHFFVLVQSVPGT